MKTQNPVAIVTGAGRRLGKHIALALASNGYDVVVNYNNSRKGAERAVKNIEEIGQKVTPLKADVSRKGEVDRMVKRTWQIFGRVDLLINNAAVFIECKIPNISEKQWDTTIDINLKGVFLCSQAVIPYFLKQKFGDIINIASLGGIQAWKEHLPYSVSKAGVIMLTKCLAKTLGPNHRVNAIAPGTIFLKGEKVVKTKHIPAEKIPLKKYGIPSDITDAVLYLSTKAPYMTGQVLVIDGGRSIQ